MSELTDLTNQVRNLNKIGTVGILTNGDDSGPFQNYEVEFLGKVSSCDVVWPYGISGRLPQGSTIYMVNQNGDEDKKAGVGTFSQERFKDLKEGEIKLGNFLLESSIKFDENGDIIVTNPGNNIVTIKKDSTITITGNSTITSTGTVTLNSTGNVTLTAPLTTINGNLQVNGNITSSGTIIGNIVSALTSLLAAGKELVGHTHGGITTGTDSTGPNQ